VPSVAQSIVLHKADDIRVQNSTCSCLLFLSHISCGEPSSQRRAIGNFPFLSASTFHCRTAGPGGSRSCRSLNLSDAESPICSLDSPLYLQTHVVLRCHKSSQVHKLFVDFEIFVAKSHSLSGVDNHPISSRNHVFCLLFVDLHSYFCCFCFQC
jgi:hypothetical protein